MVPSLFIISHITDEVPQPESLLMSTEASVCPDLTSTPPFFATIGKTCPGETKSLEFEFFLIAVFIVFDLSWAEIPVVIPFFASIDIVKAVPLLAIVLEYSVINRSY